MGVAVCNLKFEIFSTHKAFPYTVYNSVPYYLHYIPNVIIFVYIYSLKNLYTFLNIPHEIRNI